FCLIRLPKDVLTLAIVDPKPLSIVSAVSEKDDFFKNTPRKTLSQLSETRQLPSLTYTGDNTILSDAPEGSLMLSAESSGEVERTDLTPAKRRGTSIVNLEEAVDQNSVTRIHVLLESRRKRLKQV
ncbi:unnamed protein product, partial [Brassica oleracea]